MKRYISVGGEALIGSFAQQQTGSPSAVIHWLLKKHHDKLVAWLEGMNTAKNVEALKRAFDGWSGDDLDKAWRKYVSDNF